MAEADKAAHSQADAEQRVLARELALDALVRELEEREARVTRSKAELQGELDAVQARKASDAEAMKAERSVFEADMAASLAAVATARTAAEAEAAAAKERASQAEAGLEAARSAIEERRRRAEEAESASRVREMKAVETEGEPAIFPQRADRGPLFQGSLPAFTLPHRSSPCLPLPCSFHNIYVGASV